METLERLLVTIEGSSELLRQELRKGGADVDKWARETEARVGKVDNSFKKIAGTLRTTLASFGIGLSVGAVINFTRNAIQAADAIGETAKQAGFGAERFQRLGFVFRQNGVTAQEFEGGMRTLNTRLGQFITTGAGPAAKAIEQLGLKQRMASGEIRTSEQLFDAVVESLSRVDNAAQLSALSVAFFGREVGSKLAPTMQQGSEALNAAADAATGIFTDETVRKADELGDAMDRLGAATWNWAKGLAVAAAHRAGQSLGVTELQPGEEEERANLLERQRTLRAFGRDLGTDEATRLADLEAQLANRGRFRTGRTIEFTDGPPTTPMDGLLPITSRGQTASGFSDLLRRPAGMNAMPSLLPLLQEIKTPGRISNFSEMLRLPEGMNAMPDFTKALESIAKYNDELEKTKERQQALWNTLGHGLQSALSNAFRGVSTKFSDLLKDMAADLAASALTKGIMSLFSGGTAAGGGGGFFANWFGGARARGGSVQRGKGYLVGEDGPEPFFPGMSGTILPNSALAGAGGVNINITQANTFTGGDPRQQAAAIAANNAQLKREIKAEIQDLTKRGRF